MTFRSKFEGTIAKQIGPRGTYESRTIRFTQPAKARTYKPDWVLSNGIVIEAKGVLDLACRQKMLWVREQHPELDIRFVFQRANNPIRRGSKTTYGAWADANGFPWCERVIPQAWFH